MILRQQWRSCQMVAPRIKRNVSRTSRVDIDTLFSQMTDILTRGNAQAKAHSTSEMMPDNSCKRDESEQSQPIKIRATSHYWKDGRRAIKSVLYHNSVHSIKICCTKLKHIWSVYSLRIVCGHHWISIQTRKLKCACLQIIGSTLLDKCSSCWRTTDWRSMGTRGTRRKKSILVKAWRTISEILLYSSKKRLEKLIVKIIFGFIRSYFLF